ncbi:3-oxo-tetronate kinase [Phyllobacterium sp. SB3]|uniref:3-oxo-tetronate kinase n=1 Tax=Phyllobacterium sp. SB3 TaxID=3156073 RepID=UPI0032AEDE2F
MLLGVIADDFTGASDIASTLAKGGMATFQFVGVPEGEAAKHCEAGVVALKTRSIEPDDAVRQSLQAARWLVEQGCRQIVFKYCSTFDSTPKGNIGPVAEALADFLGADVAVVCPAFPATGRRVFMGHLFVGEKLLNESGMERHPLTPMTDASLRRWLGLQTKAGVGLIPLDMVRSGTGALANAFAYEVQAGNRFVVTDAVSDEDLFALGEAIAGHNLITGGSGIALGLPDNFRKKGLLAGGGSKVPTTSGPAVVLCGSCSQISRNQVADYLKNHPGLTIKPDELAGGRMNVETAYGWYIDHADANPIIYSSDDPAAVSAAQGKFGASKIAEQIEHFFASLARKLADSGVRRIIVGGGETSGAVVSALDLDTLQVGREIDPGVPILVAARNGPLGLALKSGNFGSTDFFAKALAQIETN